jgi:hypothetical protein
LGVSIRGRVVDDLGAPVMGARIVATLASADGRSGGRLTTATRGTDATFVCNGIAPGKVTLDVSRSGLVPARWTSGINVEGDEIGDVTIVLAQGKRISGEVLWPPGQPKRACTVVARPRPNNAADRTRLRPPVSSTSVRDDGSFEITGLGDELVDLTIDVQIDEPAPNPPASETDNADAETARTRRRGNRRPQPIAGRQSHWSARADAIEPGATSVRLELRASSNERSVRLAR